MLPVQIWINLSILWSLQPLYSSIRHPFGNNARLIFWYNYPNQDTHQSICTAFLWLHMERKVGFLTNRACPPEQVHAIAWSLCVLTIQIHRYAYTCMLTKTDVNIHKPMPKNVRIRVIQTQVTAMYVHARRTYVRRTLNQIGSEKVQRFWFTMQS